MQCPDDVHKALKGLFGFADRQIRVIQTATGGGFGGKEEYPNVIAGHAALLARKAGRPVTIVYDRHEDMLATTKRHPARVRHRTGVRRDGTLVAQDIDIVMDGGAYVTLSPVVLSRGALHATGPDSCPNVRVRARAVATNTPPNGAFRGFGAPQTLFAAELHMEKIAATLGIDAVVLRRKNLVGKGSVLATGQVLRESIGARPVLDTCVKRLDYRATRRAHDWHNRDPRQTTWKGIGLAVVHHGSGFTGRGEVDARQPGVGRPGSRRHHHGARCVHGDRPGHDDDACANHRGCTGGAGGLGGRRGAGTTWKVPNSGPTCRQPHVHGRRRPPAARGGALERPVD